MEEKSIVLHHDNTFGIMEDSEIIENRKSFNIKFVYPFKDGRSYPKYRLSLNPLYRDADIDFFRKWDKYGLVNWIMALEMSILDDLVVKEFKDSIIKEFQRGINSFENQLAVSTSTIDSIFGYNEWKYYRIYPGYIDKIDCRFYNEEYKSDMFNLSLLLETQKLSEEFIRDNVSTLYQGGIRDLVKFPEDIIKKSNLYIENNNYINKEKILRKYYGEPNKDGSWTVGGTFFNRSVFLLSPGELTDRAIRVFSMDNFIRGQRFNSQTEELKESLIPIVFNVSEEHFCPGLNRIRGFNYIKEFNEIWRRR